MYTVVKYGVVRIESNLDLAEKQNLLRQRYWNKLVEVEKAFQERRESIITDASPDLAAAKDDLEATRSILADLRQAAAQHRRENRTRAIPRYLQDSIKAQRKRVADANERYKTARALVFQNADLLGQLRLLDGWRTEQVRLSRNGFAADGLWWGNYKDVEASYNAARKRNGNRLRFHRSTQDRGTVSVWFQQGLPTDIAWGEPVWDSRLRLEPIPAAAWDPQTRRGDRRRQSATTACLRIGSQGNNKTPIHITAAIKAHRPIPNGLIRHASLAWETIGGKRRYRLVITVDTPEYPRTPAGLESRFTAVALDVGWRVKEDGSVRAGVAVWAGPGEAKAEEIAIPDRMVRAWRKVHDLQSIRDLSMEEWRPRCIALIDDMSAKGTALPGWLIETRTAMPLWKSNRRMLALRDQWRESRFPGDEAAYALMDAWAKQEKHLWQWQANLRDRIQADRQEAYRRFAARVARESRMAVMEELDLTRIKELPESETATRYYQSLTSTSTLRNRIEHTCQREGVPLEKEDAKNTTQRCMECKRRTGADVIMGVDAGPSIKVVCPKCGTKWDQDVLACLNLLERAGYWSGGGPPKMLGAGC